MSRLTVNEIWKHLNDIKDSPEDKKDFHYYTMLFEYAKAIEEKDKRIKQLEEKLKADEWISVENDKIISKNLILWNGKYGKEEKIGLGYYLDNSYESYDYHFIENNEIKFIKKITPPIEKGK